ncbi:MAG: tetratricopeptide repeat protein [Acidobacteriia bacterium]|nr:tetratricopeptide repeat protein [Terriglobia bacterium]
MSAAFATSILSAQTEAKRSSEPAVVSVDLLRHPVSARVRPLLLKAVDKIESGDHEAAIEQLKDMLAKFPDSAPYVHDLLGVAYVKTDRCEAAVTSFEQAALLLPHDPTTQYYLGLALLCAGDYERATQEIQRAVKLDPQNLRMQARLNALLERKHSGN